MKKTFKMVMGMLLMIVMALPLASCSNDDDGKTTFKEKELFGTWVNNTIQNAGTSNESTVLYLFTFNEDHTGVTQRVETFTSDLSQSNVATRNFTYEFTDLEVNNQAKVRLIFSDTEIVTYVVQIIDGKLMLDNDAFEKTEKNKDLVGTWFMQEIEKGIKSTTTFEFKKNGTGWATLVEENLETGFVENYRQDFTYTVTEADETGFQVLVTVNSEDGETITYNVKVDGDVLYMDEDILYRKK